MRRGSLTKNPQPHAMKVDGRVVIAGDVATVPPTGLDTLRLAEEAQRPATPRQAITLGQKPRHRQQPQGAAKSAARGTAASCAVARYSVPHRTGSRTPQAFSGR